MAPATSMLPPPLRHMLPKTETTNTPVAAEAA
eukprot:CAMPEP_0203012114 /NCGR_PEP_ID=MMETSP1401-20130829/13316_1 /ASSEMBLY_ACC=CAM_ASM_000894 /TAXON_ID=38833 /ORGANISM="Micromonas pusilla, Strain CCAC1681" /LENGTH=31 /DNA_ID= /DNA_START= /DNA_END= /DNA_ORIENTATION=